MTEELGARVTLKDRVQFARDARATAEDIEHIGDATVAASTRGSIAAARFAAVLRGVGVAAKQAWTAAVAASNRLLLGVGALGGGLLFLASRAIQAAGAFEQSQIAFEGLLGSAEAGNRMLERLAAFSAATPFEFVHTQELTRQLLAFDLATRRTAIPTMRILGDEVAKLGKGPEAIQQIIVAFQQMSFLGQARIGEVRQLGTAGVNAMKYMSEAFGISVERLSELMTQGRIKADDAIAAILMGMQKNSEGMMKVQSQTLLGLWSTVKDQIGLSLNVLGGEIVETFDLKTKLRGAIDWLSAFRTLLQERGLKGAWEAMVPVELRDRIDQIAGALTGALAPALAAIAGRAAIATIRLLPFMLIGAAIADSMGLQSEGAAGVDEKMTGLSETMVGLMDKTVALFDWFGKMPSAMQGVVGVLMLIAMTGPGAALALRGVAGALTLLATNPVVALVAALALVITQQEAIVNWFGKAIDAAREFFGIGQSDAELRRDKLLELVSRYRSRGEKPPASLLRLLESSQEEVYAGSRPWWALWDVGELGSRAHGGNVIPGSSYLVGEVAPEVFTPDQPGRIESVTNAIDYSGGATVTIEELNIYEAQDARKTYRAVKKGIEEALARA